MKNTPALPLHAGPLRLLFDNGMIRSVRCGDVEIVRRVYMALRDRYGNTIPYTMSNLTVERNDVSFNVSFDAHHDAPGIAFTWYGAIAGAPEGVVTLSMRGEAKSTFFRNRIGLCVLHPLALCKGAACAVEMADGTVEHSRFPGDAITPRQLFSDIRAMTYPVAPGVECSLRFTGDLFETEDQRNWTDASFKTYSTPLSLPVPVLVGAGSRIGQQVTIAVSGVKIKGKRRAAPLSLDVATSFGESTTPPGIGLMFPFGQPLSPGVAERLSALHLSHLRFDIYPRSDAIDDRLSIIASVCAQCGCSAEIALFLTSGFAEELAAIAQSLRARDVPVCRVLIFRNDVPVTPPETIDAARRHLAAIVPKGGIAAGTDRHFVEINRASPVKGPFDALCFSATPQVHTFDDRAVMENLEGLRECILFARTIAAGKPIAVSPLTLRPRNDPARPEKSGGVDPRLQELFGAAWLVGAIGACIQAGLSSLTCCDAVGSGGIMREDGEELFPLYHVLSTGITCSSSARACTIASGESMIAAMLMQSAAQRILLLANLTDTVETVIVRGLVDGSIIVHLDASTEVKARREMLFWEKQRQPLDPLAAEQNGVTLTPYGVSSIVFP